MINIFLNSCPINNSDTVKYLGVVIDSKLHSQEHINIDYIVQSKLLRAVGILGKLRYSSFKNFKTALFCVLHPHFHYSLII